MSEDRSLRYRKSQEGERNPFLLDEEWPVSEEEHSMNVVSHKPWEDRLSTRRTY